MSADEAGIHHQFRSAIPEFRNSPLQEQWRRPSNPHSILIVRLGSMGDIIHTLPAVSLLRDAFADAQLGWVVEERWAELLASRTQLHSVERPLSPEKPLINALHTVRTRDWRRRPFAAATRHEVASSLRELRGSGYDLAIDFQSAIRSAVLARLAKAKQLIGPADAHEEPASLFYSQRVETNGRHVVEQNVSLAAAAVPNGQLPTARDYRFELPHGPQNDTWADEQLCGRGIRDFCLLNVGAGWGAKVWPAERWAEVTRGLAQQGLRCVVNFGPGEEAVARKVEAECGGAAVAFASSVGQLIALVRRARLCIGGDTGPTHLAAAVGVPVVAIYGPTDPARNRPFGPSTSLARIAVLRSEISITSHARRAEPEAGLLRITPQLVIAAAREVLQT